MSSKTSIAEQYIIPKRVNTFNWYFKGLVILAIAVIMATTCVIILHRWINPTTTWLMVERYFVNNSTRLKPVNQQWIGIKSISPHVAKAAIAAEDNLFLTHKGFDFESIRKAQEDITLGKRFRGASTISMQVAKNVYLWHNRTWTRKVFEAGFTVFIETLWSKRRIMEVYLNVAEFGPSVYGIEAASKKYFNKSASALTKNEAALMMTVLPSPLKRNPASPSAYMKQYQQRVIKTMHNIGEVKL
ncbi:MAG: monofunctional biosynthetic peptidoglycan transglycosylase [Bacteroidales bacterium]|jgi:monofunctional biosynthetic peptidoglycan transglycosylase|nr:monofunctional biosynthetic peptidoglycan transglycosylase [Bacteroidales bacterium]MDD3893161.1 monofunctional biosynthetic peptidoglycan transglycosylase [Bacteroidales bacterium]